MKRTMITVASWLYTLHNDSLYIYTLLYTASTFSQKSSLQHLDQVTEEDPTRRRHGLVRRRPSGHRGRRPHWAHGHRRSRHSRVRRGRTILLGEAENHRKFKLNIGLAMAANRKIILHSFNFWFGKSTSYGWCSQLSTSIHLGDIPWPAMATFTGKPPWPNPRSFTRMGLPPTSRSRSCWMAKAASSGVLGRIMTIPLGKSAMWLDHMWHMW